MAAIISQALEWLSGYTGVLSMNELLKESSKACIDYYMATHVSQMKNKTDIEKRIWSVGQELYHARKLR
jgi:hypothetical protein